MSVNKLYYLLGVLTTAVSVMVYVEIVEPDIPTQTKTETVVRMVNVPIAPSDYTAQAEEIKSSLNKSKLKHILIYIEALCWEYGVDYEMVKAVQILPSTAMSEFQTPKQDLFDPYVNVTVGIKYLSQLNEHFDDLESTLTAYSHGPTVTKKYSNNYISNNFYVKRVQKNLK